MAAFSEVLREPSPSHRVALALDYASEERSSFPSSPDVIQGFIVRLKEQEPTFFDDFVFESRNVHPFSQEVYDALFQLENASILTEDNPRWVKYTWNETERVKLRDDLTRRFSEADRIKVRAAVAQVMASFSF